MCCSWLRHTRPKTGGEEEAREAEGKKDARMGQEIDIVLYCMIRIPCMSWACARDAGIVRQEATCITRNSLRNLQWKISSSYYVVKHV